MHKKLIMACMAIAAFAAFVVAPAASATSLTEEGKLLAVGTSTESKNVEVAEFKTSAGVVSCTNDTLKGKVTANPGGTGTVKGEIPVGSAIYKGTGTSEDCTSSIFGVGGSVAVTVNSKLCFEFGTTSADILKITGCGSQVTFTLAFTGGPTCTYTANSISGTFSTNVTPAVGTIAGGAMATAVGESTNSPFCPTSGELFQKFNLTTIGGGTGLTLS